MRGGWVAVAAALALGAAVAATWPLGRYVDRVIVTPTPRCAGGCADAKLALWTVTEGGRRLYDDPRTVFEATVFHPLRHALAFSDSGLALGALAAPINAATDNPLIGFNVVYLASYVLTGLGTFLVVLRLTGAPLAAVVALVMVVGAPERAAARADVFSLATLWLPFLLYATLACLDRPTWRSAACLATLVVLHGHSGVAHGAALPIVLVPWLVGLLMSRRTPVRAWLATAAALALGGGLLVASYGPRYAAYEELAPVTIATSTLERWGRGALADLTTLASGAVRPPAGVPPRGLLPVLLVVAALAASGRRWAWATIAAVGSAAVAVLLSVRMDASVFMAVAGGLATAALLERCRGRTTTALVGVSMMALALIESPMFGRWTPLTPMPEVVEPPAIYRWLARQPPGTTVFEVPAGDADTDATYMVAALRHRRALVNGYAPRGVQLPVVSSFPQAGAIIALADVGVDYVLLHLDRISRPQRMLRHLMANSALTRERIGRTVIIRVPGVRTAAVVQGPQIPRAAWRLVSGQTAAADGDLATHWRMDAPGPDDALEIELEGVWSLTGVSLELGAHLLGYPDEWVVRGSLKQAKWRRVGHAHDAIPPFQSYRVDHRRVTMPLGIRIGAVRSVMISPEWSRRVDIHELTLYGTQIGGPPVSVAPAAP